MSLPARDPVLGAFEFGEKGGIAAPSTDVFAPFDGFSAGPGVRGATLPLGTSVGDAGATYRKSNMFGFDQDNGSIVRQYVSDHKSVMALKEDTGVGHILFSCNRRMKKHMLAKEAGRARAEDPKFYGVQEPLEFKSLPRLLAWLKSKEGRAMFGNDRDCTRLRQMYKLAGVQVSKVHDALASNDEMVLAITTARRARTKDFTIINGKGAQMNDVVFLVWRRFKYQGVPMPSPGQVKVPVAVTAKKLTKRAEAKLGLVEEGDDDDGDADMEEEETMADRVREMKRTTKGPSVVKKALAIKAVTEPGIIVDKVEDEYFWSADIWYGPRGTQPGQALYLPDDGSFIGDIDFLGYVVELYGDRSQKLTNQANAKTALYEASGSGDWKVAFVALPDIEIHLKIR